MLMIFYFMLCRSEYTCIICGFLLRQKTIPFRILIFWWILCVIYMDILCLPVYWTHILYIWLSIHTAREEEKKINYIRYIHKRAWYTIFHTNRHELFILNNSTWTLQIQIFNTFISWPRHSSVSIYINVHIYRSVPIK